jgi:hypothetical protein
MSQTASSGQPRVCLKACLIVVHTSGSHLAHNHSPTQATRSLNQGTRRTQHAKSTCATAAYRRSYTTLAQPCGLRTTPYSTPPQSTHPTQTGSAPRPNTTPHWLETHLHRLTLASTTAHLLQTLIHHQAARFNTLDCFGSKPILLEAVRCGGASVTTEAPPPDTATTTRKIPAIQLF